MAIRFIVDSACDLDREYANSNNIVILPLAVSFGAEEYLDGVNLTSEEFYHKLESGKVMPKTSLVNQFAWETAFKEALDAGDKVLALTLSSKISGTYNAAMLAKESLNSEDVFVLDSAQVTIAAAALVIEGVKMAAEGKQIEEIYERLNVLKHKVRLLAGIHTLKYLKEGGRLSAVAAMVGTLISIKPVMTVLNGVVASVGKTIGFKKAQELMCNKMSEFGFDETLPVYFGHTNAKDALQGFIDMVKSKFKIIGGKILTIGSTVGSYSGSGAVGLAFFTKEPAK